jgi:hypothetical protein
VRSAENAKNDTTLLVELHERAKNTKQKGFALSSLYFFTFVHILLYEQIRYTDSLSLEPLFSLSLASRPPVQYVCLYMDWVWRANTTDKIKPACCAYVVLAVSVLRITFYIADD